MKVGVTQLIAPREWSMIEFFEKTSATGYEAVELACRDEGELTPDTSDSDLAEIAARAREAGLELNSMTHGHSRAKANLLAAGAAQRYGIERTRKALEQAAKLGIRCTLHTLGTLSADVGYGEAYANGVCALQELAVDAERLDVAIAVEFVWNGFLFSPLEMKRFLDDVGSSHVGFYFDPGNMAVFHYPQHWVHELRNHIKRVHLKDWTGRALNGGWRPLLEGAVDFEAVMRELRAAGYDGALISEVALGLAPLEDTAAAIRRIMEMGRS
ncbi:MAG: sugar phosphate isomerase/epimerase [Kiritimatiellaeota bacterium]|nr:sugar phosphate isomerase/epimerase [Kiritimatiellota bacterium]